MKTQKRSFRQVSKLSALVTVSIALALVVLTRPILVQNDRATSPTLTPTQELNPSPTPTVTATPTPTPAKSTTVPRIPLVDCIGPDGKSLRVTQKACDEFNSAWKPTATPTTKPGMKRTNPVGYPTPGNTPNTLLEELSAP